MLMILRKNKTICLIRATKRFLTQTEVTDGFKWNAKVHLNTKLKVQIAIFSTERSV